MAAGIARMAAAGALIGVGTDGGGQTGDQFVGWTVHTEVENMVAAGMTPAQVLTAATRNGAAILGLDDLGTIAAGKSADFIVLDANPLDDITNTRRIAQVYLRGTAVDRARLASRWTGTDHDPVARPGADWRTLRLPEYATYRDRVSRAALVVVGVLCCAASGGAWWLVSTGRPSWTQSSAPTDAETPPAVKRLAVPWAPWTVTEQLVAGSVLVLQMETTTSTTR